jgi:hypothetical protein
MTAPPAEQVFFRDPAMDRLLGVVMALASEVFVLRQQVRLLTGDNAPGDADAFVRHVLSPVLGEMAGPLA